MDDTQVKEVFDDLFKFDEQIEQALSKINPPKVITVNPNLENGNSKIAIVKRHDRYTYYEKALKYNGIPFLIGVTMEESDPIRDLYFLFNTDPKTSKFKEDSQFHKDFIKKRHEDGAGTWFTIKDPLNAEFFQDGTKNKRKEDILAEILTAVCAELDKP